MSRILWLTSGSFLSVLIGWSCFESCLTGFEVVARFSGLTFCPKMFISRLSFYTAVPVLGLVCCRVMTVSGLACCTVVTCFRQKPACNKSDVCCQRYFRARTPNRAVPFDALFLWQHFLFTKRCLSPSKHFAFNALFLWEQPLCAPEGAERRWAAPGENSWNG